MPGHISVRAGANHEKTGVSKRRFIKAGCRYLLLEGDGFFRALLYAGLAGSAIIRTSNLGLLVLNIKHFTRTNI
jgi:hypothetical protein